MSMVKRSVSMLLVVVMLFSMIPVNTRAAEGAVPQATQSNGVTVRGTNGFGALLSEDIIEYQETAQSQDGGYSVTNLVIEGNVAAVTYNSLEDATAVVALYTEDGMQLLLSGTAPALATETMAIVEFEGDMPEYFMASAYLLDNYDFSPLCSAYDTPMYTKEMQELLASTVEDYETDRVLNLDEDTTTNFAVYAETTKVIEYVEGVNTVVSADDETASYVIANADEQVTSLMAGDIFAYPYGDNEVLIVKVDSITLDGTTATIIGAEVEMEEAFSHVKVEAKGTSDDMTYEDGSGDEGVSYLGMAEKTSDDATTFAMPRDTEYETKLSMKFKLDKTLVKQESEDETVSFEIKINGTVELSTSVKLSYYVSLKRQFLEFRVESDMKCAVSIDAKLEEAMMKLGYFGMAIVPGVYVDFSPKLFFEFGVKAEVSFSVQTTTGFSYETGKGFQNLSTAPIAKCTTEIEGSVSVGFDLDPNVGILGGVVEAGIDAKIELVVSGKLTGTDYEHIDTSRYTAAERHGCQKCLDGDVEVKLTVAAWVEFLKIDALRFKITFLEMKWKLFDFYHSYDQDVRDFGECPYLEYRLTVYVQDETGASVEGAKIATDSGESWGTTNSSGILVKYVPAGNYALRTTVSGEVLEHSVVVTKATKVTLKAGEKAVVSENVTQNSVTLGDSKDDYSSLGRVTHSGTCGNNVYWELYSSGTLRIYGSGEMDDYDPYSYPPCYTPWHSECMAIKSVIIDDGVTSIGDHAFDGCGNLTSVTIPESVTSIDLYAFDGCSSLSSITIPEGVTFIEIATFSGCSSLTSITIPEGVTGIGIAAFSGCSSLRSITIPDSVTSIGFSAFEGCSSLSSITIPDGVTSIESGAFDGCTGLTSITIPDSVTSIGNYAFSKCSSLTSITIPEGVTSIGDYAFSKCSSLTSITIPDSVTSVGDHAFGDCESLTSITIPDGVTSIEDSTFSNCSSLTSITIPDSVTSIDAWAFYNCSSLTSITIPEGVTSIGDYAFRDCGSLTSITIPEGVTSIGYGAFSGCSSLTSITIPDGVTSIESCTFLFCSSLTSITIPDGVTSIGDDAFAVCSSLTSITIPDSVTSIGEFAFADCSSLTSITIPEGVTSIGGSAFSGCSSLTSITIPDSVTNIGDYAFSKCSSLTSIQFCGNPPAFSIGVFTDVTATAYYPVGNAIWTEDVMQDYGGNITWVPYIPDEDGTVVTETSAETVSTMNMGTVEQAADETGTVEVEEIEEETTSADEVIDYYAVWGGEYGTELTDTYTLKTASFKDLVPGKEYVLLALVSVDTEDILAADNLLYIDQAVAAEDGTLVFKYAQRTQTELSYVVACGPSNKDLANATIVFPEMFSDGETHVVAPTVAYDGAVLTENRDYVIVGDVDYTETGEYTCYIRGIYNYAGLVKCQYTVASEPEKIDVAFSQVDMGNALGMRFAFPASDAIDWTGAYAVATMAGNAQTIPATAWETANIGGAAHYVFGYSNISAKQMADNISIVIYNANGQAVSNEYNDSIRAYVMRNVDKKDAESKALMVDMLNYGAAAQVYYGYNTADLANAKLSDEQKAYGTADLTKPEDIRVKGTNYQGTRLELGSSIGMQMKFADTTADMYAVIEFTNHNATEVSERVAPTLIGSDYLIDITQIAVADGRMPITVTVYNADGTVYGSATDSMASYIARMSNADALYENILKFSDSAYAYLH